MVSSLRNSSNSGPFRNQPGQGQLRGGRGGGGNDDDSNDDDDNTDNRDNQDQKHLSGMISPSVTKPLKANVDRKSQSTSISKEEAGTTSQQTMAVPIVAGQGSEQEDISDFNKGASSSALTTILDNSPGGSFETTVDVHTSAPIDSQDQDAQQGNDDVIPQDLDKSTHSGEENSTRAKTNSRQKQRFGKKK